MFRLANAVLIRPKKRQAMTTRHHQASCHGTKPAAGGSWRAPRRRSRVRAVVGARPRRLGRLLLRLRVRLSGVVAMLLRGVDELGCRPSGGAATSSSSSKARARVPPPPHCHARLSDSDQSSFYAEAIADCLEFIKRGSSCLER